MEADEIKIMNRDELISAAVEKHERFIAEYKTEYDALTSGASSLNREIEDLKSSIETAEEKIGVFDEKKHHAGYEAEEELKNMNLSPADVEKIKKGLSELVSSKTSDTVEERKAVYDALAADIKGLDGDVSGLLAKADASFKAYLDGKEAAESLTAQKTSLGEKEKETGENKRVGWLEKRIESHQDALVYWKGMK
ncbi:hypothetical protein MsAg5_04290 [Methanosarcinaceae archaeon Ag5]|uniref:Uncharacterized protein n=1 Tax=Methanolapillus africanus TaxID=3028297 RepID=A0AAE4MIJ3_9EURY|nr:hypothetical protein [Methanosarcinaceae archaeon Ag5]